METRSSMLDGVVIAGAPAMLEVVKHLAATLSFQERHRKHTPGGL